MAYNANSDACCCSASGKQTLGLNPTGVCSPQKVRCLQSLAAASHSAASSSIHLITHYLYRAPQIFVTKHQLQDLQDLQQHYRQQLLLQLLQGCDGKVGLTSLL